MTVPETTPPPSGKPRRAAAKKARTSASDGPISLRWNLAELPSSQHKAGLAGLAICVGYLQRKPDRVGVCEVEALDPGGLTLKVDRAGMQSLFDDIYAASLEEQERDKPFQNLFVVRPDSEGRQYMLYVIREEDDLKKIGEALHKVTGFPRVLTYPVIENAYFRQFFNYDNDQDVDITTPEQVQTRAGETLQLILPVEDYPEFDFATRINLYNQ